MTPHDGNLYVRLQPSLEWVVERWQDDEQEYERVSVSSREAGFVHARQWAAVRSVKAFLLDLSGTVTPIPST